jgi:DeoR/GlpR family transcriptional regulator of sugar metabolism
MLVAERQREIVGLIERERSVRVTQLARRFSVTEETIRRDLERLEREGKLVRSHGGAVSSDWGGREAPAAERAVLYVPEKTAIAREAVTRIGEGDTILVDASTTALQMVRLIPDMPLTVVTNSIQVCLELVRCPRVRIVCTGGALSAASLSFVGSRAEEMLADYHVNRLFFSCTGIDLDHGLSDVNEAQAALKQRMLAAADHSYLLADRSKFGIRALKRFGQLADVQTLITNDGLDDETVADLQERSGVNLVMAPIR